MRFNKLYFKIFLAFFVTIISAEAVVYGIILKAGPPPPFIRNAVKDATLTGRLIQRDLRDALPPAAEAERTLKPLMRLLAKRHTKIWLTDEKGYLIATSFDGMPPEIDGELTPIQLQPDEKGKMFTLDGGSLEGIYLKTPIRLTDGTALEVHTFMTRRPFKEEVWFLKGLLLLTILSALFLFPVARGIIRPIRRLSEAADRLGQGDFSQQVAVKGGDEVAELANKFNKMAKRLARMVISGRELTAHLSHELRTPLARMRISVQMAMEQSGDDSKVNRHLGKIGDEIDNMDTIIGQILDLSKLDLREPPPRTDSVDPSRRLDELLQTYGPMIEQKELRIEKRFAPTPELLCYSHGLDVLLNNVLSNAMKYTEPGGTIAVSTRADDSHIVLEICNTHPPLNEKDLEDMFIPFNRLYRTNEVGTGLGLASARRIAEIYDGSIRAGYSEDKVCFLITLPFNR